MKLLVVGSGGREHALAWKLSQGKDVEALFVAPGNAGTKALPNTTNVPISATDIDALVNFAKQEGIHLAVIGPEAPLVAGLADALERIGVRTVGVGKDAAMLEGSKAFAKDVMRAANIPTAKYSTCHSRQEAMEAIEQFGYPVVVKADGLAAGKGVSICHNQQEAALALDAIFVRRSFGDAGNRVVVEEFLQGEEVSFIALVDGEKVLPFASSQDHKAAFDGDTGPNTGGMGAYSPAPVVDEKIEEKIMSQILSPLAKELASRGIRIRGVLYCGLMISNDTPYVLEFNVRFGDPETQPLMMRLKSDLADVFWKFANGQIDDITLQWDERFSVCVVMASKGYPGSYEKGFEISGIEQAEAIGDVVVFHAGTAERDGKTITAGGRVLGVTSLGNTLGQAIDRAYAAVSKIHWDGAFFRKDIGMKGLNRLRGVQR